MMEEFTFFDLLKNASESAGKKDAFRFPGEGGEILSVTYRQFFEDAKALGISLHAILNPAGSVDSQASDASDSQASGARDSAFPGAASQGSAAPVSALSGTVSPGSGFRHIALLGENSFPWILSFFAVTISGNVAVPIDKDLPSAKVLELCRKTDCSAVICSEKLAENISGLQNEGLSVIPMSTLPKLLSEGKILLSKALLPGDSFCCSPKDPAAIFFTSGTTGEMKGAVLSHWNLLSDALHALESADRRIFRGNGTILALPLHHTFSVFTVLQAISNSQPVFIGKSLRTLKADFQKAQPDYVTLVPMIADSLLKMAEKTGAGASMFGGNFQAIFAGGAAVPQGLIEGYRALGIRLFPGYGITECAPLVALSGGLEASCSGISPQEIPGAWVIPCNEVKIAPDGEILVRGQNVFSGYYNNPAATEEAFSDGWFKTGDLGTLDADGRLLITGRKKNLIILSNGENVSAEELERLLFGFPYVREVLCYGADDVIVAEAYLDPESDGTAERFSADVEALNASLPNHKKIGKTIVRATEFPKTSSHKIKRGTS